MDTPDLIIMSFILPDHIKVVTRVLKGRQGIINLKTENVWVRKAMERKMINDHGIMDSGLNRWL